MKLQITTFTAAALLIALTGTASADWWDGWNNGNGSGQGYGSGQGNARGDGNLAGDYQGSGNGWGTGKGDADGEVDFTITFKGKGKTDMDTAGNLSGNSRGSGNSAGNWAGQGNTAGNFAGNGYGEGDNSGYGSPWGNNNWRGANRGYSFAPMPQTRMMAPGYAAPRYATPGGVAAPSFQQQQAQMEAMRKKFEAMAQQIAVQQKAAADAYQKSRATSAKATTSAPAPTTQNK